MLKLNVAASAVSITSDEDTGNLKLNIGKGSILLDGYYGGETIKAILKGDTEAKDYTLDSVMKASGFAALDEEFTLTPTELTKQDNVIASATGNKK